MTAAQARLRFLILLGLRWFPTGLMIPVMALLPLERGLTIAQLGVVASLQGFIVLFLELPTGGLSDAAGRRPVMLIAGVINLVALGLWVSADTLPLFALVWAMQGVYRALDSGPLEAWFVDHALAADPDADIETGLSRSGVVAGLAIGAGALLSGGLVWLGPIGSVSALTVPVLAALAASVVATAAVALLMSEDRPARGVAAFLRSVRDVPVAIGGALSLARRSRVVLALLGVELLWSFGMVTFEKLMPVRLSEVTADPATAAALLGPVSSVAWAASAAGSALIPLLSRRIGAQWTGFTLRIAHGATIVGMGLLAGPVGVITAFLLCYTMHGASEPVQGGLLHRQVDGDHRTSLLSLASMVGQPGFAFGAILLTAVAQGVSTSVAIVIGAVVLAAAAPLYLVNNRPEPEFQEQIDGGISRSSALTPGGN